MVNTFNPQLKANAIHTIKESLPDELKSILIGVNDLNLIMTQVRLKMLVGRRAFTNLFHTPLLSKPEFYCMNHIDSANRIHE